MTKQRLAEIIDSRLEKVKKIKDLGVDPYPSMLDGNSKPILFQKDKQGEYFRAAGRLMGFRVHGNVMFADLMDDSGSIQLWFQKNKLQQNYTLAKLLDVGDYIYTEGVVTKTKAGEISCDVDKFQLLTKTVRPLPDTWYGLKDVEERYRKRYLDFIINPQTKKTILTRTKVIKEIRQFMDEKGYLEIETPTLQPVYGGGFAKPFVTHHNALDSDFYLRISDEMYLKRLIVGGFEKVYEITKVFRNEGVDKDHNPEFTMFEAMTAYKDYLFGMDLIEELTEDVLIKIVGGTKVNFQGTELDFKRPWRRLTLVDSIRQFTEADPLTWNTLEKAKEVALGIITDKAKQKTLNNMHKIGEVIAFVFEEAVEEKLIEPTIIYDYPIEVSPLAKKCTDECFAQRFEMFAAGIEFGNNYTELNDPVDLKKRFVEEKEREKAGFDEAHQTDTDYLEAIETGFPPTAGIAIGIDRFVMYLTDVKNIREVIAFPTLRPIKQ